MLPMLKSQAIAATTALAMITASASPSLAWGQREQDVLAGILGTIVIGSIIHEARQPPKLQPLPVVPYQRVYAPAPTSIYQSPVAIRFNALTNNKQRRIQSTLSAYGYYHGPIDGVFGAGTYNATLAFARASGQSHLTGTQAGVSQIFRSLLF